jgi:nucleotide-binding universal stress UspA family protein
MSVGPTASSVVYGVAFDDSPLSRTALARARDLAAPTGESVVAVACLPDRASTARENGWVAPEESYDIETAVRNVRAAATEIAPDATVRCETVSGGGPRGVITGRLRSAVLDLSPDVVFVGSDRAGTAATPMDSVAGTLMAVGDYDVYLVREPAPAVVDG